MGSLINRNSLKSNDRLDFPLEIGCPRAYRFGFNGKENDNEVKGNGNQQDYGFRIHDTRLGRFLSIDPLYRNFPWNSTYCFSENRPIDGIDLEGKEWSKASYYDPFAQANRVNYHVVIKVFDYTRTDMSMEEMKLIMDGVSKQFEKTYSQFDKETNTYYTVSLEYEVSNVSEIASGSYSVENGFSMFFTTTQSGPDGSYTAGSTSSLGGFGGTQKNSIGINVFVDGNKMPIDNLARTGTHELGHSGGLQHPWLISENSCQADAAVNQKFNIMNSGANPDPLLVINSNEALSATSSSLGQLLQISDAINQDLQRSGQ